MLPAAVLAREFVKSALEAHRQLEIGRINGQHAAVLDNRANIEPLLTEKSEDE